MDKCLVFFYIKIVFKWIGKPEMYDLGVDALRSARFVSKCHLQPVQVNNLLSASAATDYSWV